MLRSRIPEQHTLTLVAPLREDAQLPWLRWLFGLVQWNVWANGAVRGLIPFGEMNSVHFARFAILDADIGADGRAIPPCLLFSTEFDGPLEKHLTELIENAGDALFFVLEQCDGFAAVPGSPDDRIRRFLRERRSTPSAFYVGALGRTVKQIRKELDRCQKIRDFARQLRQDMDPILVWSQLREHTGAADWGPPDAAARREASATVRKILFWSIVVGGGLGLIAAVVAFPWLAAPIGLALLWLRMEEEIDANKVAELRAAESFALSDEQERTREERLAAFEDRWEQNQLTAITLIGHSTLRPLLQRGVLFAVRLRASLRFTRGLLDGVPTIHFGHWHVLEGGRRLLFVSNYDGSWASYLDAFTLHASGPMSAIWSQSVGFPRTRFLMWGGAEDGPRFKAFARRHQVAPSVWYSAYPDLSTEEINRNSDVVAGLQDERLGKARFRRETKKWLRKI